MLIKTHLLTKNKINTYLENNKQIGISIHTYFECNFSSSFNTTDNVIRGDKIFPKRFIYKANNFLIKIEFTNKPNRKNISELKILYPSIFDRKYIREFNFNIKKKKDRIWWHESVKYLLSIDEIIDSEEKEEESVKIHKFII